MELVQIKLALARDWTIKAVGELAVKVGGLSGAFGPMLEDIAKVVLPAGLQRHLVRLYVPVDDVRLVRREVEGRRTEEFPVVLGL
ncbi:MAG: hypothetical protein QXT91_05395 [Candidatus Caldarchaeum sp.]